VNVGGDHYYAFICCSVVDVVLCLTGEGKFSPMRLIFKVTLCMFVLVLPFTLWLSFLSFQNFQVLFVNYVI